MLIYFVAFILTYLLTWFVKYLAIRKSIMDIPNARSSHTSPTPRGGGIAVVFTWFLCLTFLFLEKKISPSLFYALLCGLPVSFIGLADDILTISPKIRLFIQIIAGSLAMYFLGFVQKIGFMDSQISAPLILSLTGILGIVWFTNLFNFLDGIDGYIGMEVLFIGLSSFLLWNNPASLLLAATTAGFLIWNWHPAKIFLGDVGSTLLGFSVGVLAVYHHNSNISGISSWLLLTSVFWFDATVTLLRRIKNREHISMAHRKHGFQRIVQVGNSHSKITVYAFILNIIGFGLVVLAFKHQIYDWFFLITDILILTLVMIYVDRKNPFPYDNHK